MKDTSVSGVIVHPDNSHHNDYLFRVSLKAVVLDRQGRILIVKEKRHDDWWDVPGGGLDHGESVKSALARELYEEVGFKGDFEYEVLQVEEPHLMKRLNLYQIRFIFVVKPDNFEFQKGDDSNEVKFVNPEMFQYSELMNEQQIYEYGQLALKKPGLF